VSKHEKPYRRITDDVLREQLKLFRQTILNAIKTHYTGITEIMRQELISQGAFPENEKKITEKHEEIWVECQWRVLDTMHHLVLKEIVANYDREIQKTMKES